MLGLMDHPPAWEGAARPELSGWPVAGTWVSSNPTSLPGLESTLGVAQGPVRGRGPGCALATGLAPLQPAPQGWLLLSWPEEGC